MGDEIISRVEAIARGLSRYFTGKPCKHGHIAERYTKRGQCLECNHITQIKKPRKQRRRVDPEERKERHRRHRRKYHEAHREEKKLRDIAWRQANPEKERARREAWRLANIDKFRAWSRARRAKRCGAEGSHTADDIQRIYEAQKCKCALCRVKLGDKYHVDHIQALDNGGSDWPRNLQVLCATCNKRKYTKDPLDFSRELGLLL